MRIQDFAQGMFVTSAVFNDEAIELTFIDDRKQTPNVMEIDTIVFPVTNDADRLNICSQIQALLQELINRVIADRRAELAGQAKSQQPPSAREAIARTMAEQAARPEPTDPLEPLQ
jgi:hypothetical protein